MANTAEVMELMDRKKIEAHNADVLSTLTDLYVACKELADRGFTILSVRLGDRYPEIMIANGKRCATLNGVRIGVRTGALGREQVMAAKVKGVQVIWVIRGN